MNLQYWDPSGWEARADRQRLEHERRNRYDDAPGTPPRKPAPEPNAQADADETANSLN